MGVKHRVAIECKDWKRPVDQGQILEFHQRIKNIGDDIVGVFVSKVGYQAGANLVAERHGILAMTANDLPTIADLVGSMLRATALSESKCVGEPFWYIAELAAGNADEKLGIEGTGNYYVFPPNSLVRIPLFFSKHHAQTYLSYLPDKARYSVFGMPQYKLRFLTAIANMQKLKLGLVFAPPAEKGVIEVVPIDVASLEKDYLL